MRGAGLGIRTVDLPTVMSANVAQSKADILQCMNTRISDVKPELIPLCTNSNGYSRNVQMWLRVCVCVTFMRRI
jgi:hypothetical protein